MTVSNLTLRRAAALREMASLGVHVMGAAILLDINEGSVWYLKERFKIDMPKHTGGPKPWLRQRLLRDYGKEGITPAILAERSGTSRNSINVTLHRLRKEGLIPRGQSKGGRA